MWRVAIDRTTPGALERLGPARGQQSVATGHRGRGGGGEGVAHPGPSGWNVSGRAEDGVSCRSAGQTDGNVLLSPPSEPRRHRRGSTGAEGVRGRKAEHRRLDMGTSQTKGSAGLSLTRGKKYRRPPGRPELRNALAGRAANGQAASVGDQPPAGRRANGQAASVGDQPPVGPRPTSVG